MPDGIFSFETARRIGDQSVLRKVDALMDWPLIPALLQRGLKRSGLGPQGCDVVLLFNKCLLSGQWHGLADQAVGCGLPANHERLIRSLRKACGSGWISCFSPIACQGPAGMPVDRA